jgi:malate permease and related proteins
MDIQARVTSAIVVLLALILLAMGLRHLGLVKEEHGPLFSRLVTRVTLPALIFESLSRSVLHRELALLALIMLAAELICLALAWLGGRALHLPRPQLGSVVLAAGFGSSALLGYALVSQIYGAGSPAIADAVVVSELGVGPALFTLGTMIAIYFGSSGEDHRARFGEALGFFRSPIFIAVLLGLAWSGLRLPTTGVVLDPLFQAVALLGKANGFIVAMTVGVLLHLQGMRSMLAVGVLVVAIKLVIQPLLVIPAASSLGAGALETQVLVLEAAMPSAMLTVVLAAHHGCDGKLASKLVFATSLVSTVSVVTMFQLLV